MPPRRSTRVVAAATAEPSLKRELSDVQTAAVKKPKPAPKRKAKAEPASELESEPEFKPESELKLEPKLPPPIAAPYDLDPNDWTVYSTPSGDIFDATLKLSAKQDNYYLIQLLISKAAPRKHNVWAQWGRVGHEGNVDLIHKDSTYDTDPEREPQRLEEAIKAFKKKFRERTALAWENRHDTPPSTLKQKYAVVSRDDSAPLAGPPKPKAEPEPPAAILTEAEAEAAEKSWVDPDCPERHKYELHQDNDGLWDATLSQVNLGNANNNKFYLIQLLAVKAEPGVYACWAHWGRVGEGGQTSMFYAPGGLDGAVKAFKKKFREKTGLAWEDRGAEPKKGKYTVIEKDYSDDVEEPAPAAEEKQEDASPEPESKLHPEVNALMDHIFNPDLMLSTMSSYGLNTNKLPLGKLSTKTITAGYLALKSLSTALAAATQDQSELAALTARYYTVIPHDFGRNQPPVISSLRQLTAELKMLQTLRDLEIANEIMKRPAGAENRLEALYAGLSLEECAPVPHSTEEYKTISAYFNRTCCNPKARITTLFRITRQGDSTKLCSFPLPPNLKSDRKLLFHGSRTANFPGILSQGLRIAPPEAPANGYAFGKGIYLADEAAKSLMYSDGGEPLMLLCEAELGDKVWGGEGGYEAGERAKEKGFVSTKYDVYKGWGWNEVGVKGCEGVWCPDEGIRRKDGSWGGQNEYVVYFEQAVRIRYLLKVSYN